MIVIKPPLHRAPAVDGFLGNLGFFIYRVAATKAKKQTPRAYEGNITAYTNESGTMIAKYSYAAFGHIIARADPMTTAAQQPTTTASARNTSMPKPVCTTMAFVSFHIVVNWNYIASNNTTVVSYAYDHQPPLERTA